MLRFGKPAAPAIATVGAGKRVWAIGDIHGCADLLQALLAQVFAMQSILAPARIVFLGDYVDRGPGSRDVIETLIELKTFANVEASFIRGNHDYMMQEFLRQPQVGQAWLAMGAGPALLSYGVEPPRNPASPSQWRETWARFNDTVPQSHRDFLAALEPSVQEGDYFFTHAGVRPGKSIARQKPTDLMWIRNAFLNDKRRLDKIVVHGHTVTSAPHSDHRRVGVDTGAYASGELTAVCIDAAERHFLQVRRTAPDRIVPVWDVPATALS